MKKEKQSSLLQNPDTVKKIESLKYFFRSRENAFSGGDPMTYEWLEDSVIRKMTSVDFGKDETGKDTATIKILNPKTGKEERVYYTTDKTEIEGLKTISRGGVIEVEATEKEPENEIES